ncbi:glycosyltransferase [Salinicoccus carnicancri]|uniref:glycosyltransferase n=1 Tax=Salinicoccus carnicancri TaxID=558170 RepID=UPI0002F8B55A|nr:glycosyltransferase [Salinicoccus carnicancri]
MKKVLCITLAFPQQRVVKTIDSLANNGYDVSLLTMNLDESKKDMFSYDNVEIINLNIKGITKFLPIKHFLLKPKIRRLRKQKFDYIICRDIFTYDLGRFFSKNKRVIVDIADNYPEVFSSFRDNKIIGSMLYNFFNIYEKLVVKSAYKIIVVTANSKKLIMNKHKTNSEKIIDISNFPLKRDVLKNNNLNSKKSFNNRLVYIGTVDDKVRDLKNFMKSIKGSTYLLTIYTFNFEYTLKVVNQYDVAENVIVRKPVNRNNLTQELSFYDIGVIPHKLIEGTRYTIPNKLYDYVHAGLVVLSSNNQALAQEVNKLELGEIYSDSLKIIESLNSIEDNYEDLRKKVLKAKNSCFWDKDFNKLLEVLN